MVNKYKKKQRKASKEARERYQNLSEEEKEKGQKKPKADIKIFLKKKKKKASVSSRLYGVIIEWGYHHTPISHYSKNLFITVTVILRKSDRPFSITEY